MYFQYINKTDNESLIKNGFWKRPVQIKSTFATVASSVYTWNLITELKNQNEQGAIAA